MPQFVDGKILFVDGKIAFHEDCCCEEVDPCEYCSGAQPDLVVTQVSGCGFADCVGGTYTWKSFTAATCTWVFHRYVDGDEELITLPGSSLPSAIKCVDGVLTGSITGNVPVCAQPFVVTYTFGG